MAQRRHKRQLKARRQRAEGGSNSGHLQRINLVSAHANTPHYGGLLSRLRVE